MCEKQLKLSQLLSLISPTIELSKSEIVLSIIGVLSGSQSLAYVWDHSRHEFIVRKGISCGKDMNENVLNTYLTQFCRYGTAFKRMFDFCYNYRNVNEEEENILCYTLNAYRSCLTDLLTAFIKQLNQIYDYFFIDCKIEDKIISLCSFKYYLDCDQNNNILLRIDILWQIYVAIREIALTQTSNSSLSFSILNAIYRRIDFQKISIKNMIYTMFVCTVEPILNYFDNVLINGIICDPHQEFIFTESVDNDINSINFWNNCIQLRSDLNEMPVFLEKHSDKLLIAAKSRVMTEKLFDLTEESDRKRSLKSFNQFLTVLNTMIKENDIFNKNIDSIETLDLINIEIDSSLEIYPKSLEMKASEKTSYDSCLNRFDVYSMHSQYYYDYNSIEFELKDRNTIFEYKLPEKTLKPIELIINEALTLTINEICSTISSNFVDLIINKYKQYFEIFCDFHLMRSSGILPKYCFELFENIRALNRSEIDIFIFENQPTFDSMPTIKPFISYLNLKTEPIHFFENVYLIHTDIEWPFNLMFDLEVVGLFNKVFQLLLKLKYCKWSLDELMFSNQFKRRQPINKFEYLTRFKLQNCLNKLYNHFMFAIKTLVEQTSDDFSRIDDFDQLLVKHNKFLSQLKQIIFHRQQTLRNLVKKLIKICSEFENNWTKNNDSRLKTINSDIDRCVHMFDCFYEVFNK